MLEDIGLAIWLVPEAGFADKLSLAAAAGNACAPLANPAAAMQTSPYSSPFVSCMPTAGPAAVPCAEAGCCRTFLTPFLLPCACAVCS